MASDWTGNRGTIHHAANFNPVRDAEAIRKAIMGFGTEEKTLINILTGRSNVQRHRIVEEYREAFGEELKVSLKGDLSGCLKHILVSLIIPPVLFDVKQLKKAMQGPGTEEKTLIEILVSRNISQMKSITQAYYANEFRSSRGADQNGSGSLKQPPQRAYQRSLTDDLISDTSGNFRKALLNLAKCRRSESPIVDAHLAKSDAEALYNAGEKKWGTDEDKFTEILCFSSVPQLKHTFSEYRKLYGKNIEDSIRSEMSGHFADLLLAIVKCVKNTPAFFAERLRGALKKHNQGTWEDSKKMKRRRPQPRKGAGTDEFTLNRILVSRSEIDLLDIRAEYKKLYGHSLYSAIRSDTFGDYRTALLRICGGDD